jgi:hypothetical protein
LSENPLRLLVVNAQRAMAAADQVDKQLESPESARIIGAGRAFLAAIDALVRPAPTTATSSQTTSLPAHPEAVASPPPKVDQMEYAGQLWPVAFRFTQADGGECVGINTRWGLIRLDVKGRRI